MRSFVNHTAMQNEATGNTCHILNHEPYLGTFSNRKANSYTRCSAKTTRLHPSERHSSGRKRQQLSRLVKPSLKKEDHKCVLW
jgi:hypothetical protein